MSFILNHPLFPQFFKIFGGLNTHFLLKRGGEIFGILETNLVSYVADTEVGILLSQSTCRLDAVVADETGHIHTSDSP